MLYIKGKYLTADSLQELNKFASRQNLKINYKQVLKRPVYICSPEEQAKFKQFPFIKPLDTKEFIKYTNKLREELKEYREVTKSLLERAKLSPIDYLAIVSSFYTKSELKKELNKELNHEDI